jgi:hypothetical protein
MGSISGGPSFRQEDVTAGTAASCALAIFDRVSSRLQADGSITYAGMFRRLAEHFSAGGWLRGAISKALCQTKSACLSARPQNLTAPVQRLRRARCRSLSLTIRSKRSTAMFRLHNASRQRLRVSSRRRHGLRRRNHSPFSNESRPRPTTLIWKKSTTQNAIYCTSPAPARAIISS